MEKEEEGRKEWGGDRGEEGVRRRGRTDGKRREGRKNEEEVERMCKRRRERMCKRRRERMRERRRMEMRKVTEKVLSASDSFAYISNIGALHNVHSFISSIKVHIPHILFAGDR